MVMRPGRQGEKQVARLTDTAVPCAGQAALEEHRAVTSSKGGGGAVRDTRTSGEDQGPPPASCP